MHLTLPTGVNYIFFTFHNYLLKYTQVYWKHFVCGNWNFIRNIIVWATLLFLSEYNNCWSLKVVHGTQNSCGAPITNPVNQCRYSWTLNSLRAHVANRVLAQLSRVATISPVNIYMQRISRCHLFHSAYLATDNHSIKTLQNYKLSGN